MTTTTEPRITLTYVGRVVSTKNKLVHKYVKKDGSSMVFGKKMKEEKIGQIMEVTETSEGVAGPFIMTDVIKDQDQLNTLIEKDRLTYTQFNMDKGFKKVAKSDYESHIRALRKIAQSIPVLQRDLFILKIMLELKKY